MTHSPSATSLVLVIIHQSVKVNWLKYMDVSSHQVTIYQHYAHNKRYKTEIIALVYEFQN